LSIQATSASLAAEPRPTYGAKPRPVWALLASPYALFLLVLLIVPFANVAFFSVHSYSPTKILLPELTFDNYRKLFDLYYLRLFGRTLRLGLITTIVCVLLGYPLAYFLARARPRVLAIGLFLLIMPLMVSTVIRLFGWIVILGRKGLVNQTLVALGLEPVKLLYTETAVVIGLVNIFLPFMCASLDCLDRADPAEPGRSGAEPRRQLAADLCAGDPAVERAGADLGVPAGLQHLDQRLCDAGAARELARAHGGAADL
jgi:hypothetical protein